jgi:peptidoglycan/xylan/chitin deacetylase (PgdA/CDA1 family)
MFHGLVNSLPEYAIYAGTRTCMLRICDFEKIVKYCANNFYIAGIADIPRYLSGEANENGVILTFDDGLASVPRLALPVLRKYNVSAVMFLTVGWLDNVVEPPVFSVEAEIWARIPVRVSVSVNHFSYSMYIFSKRQISLFMDTLWRKLFAHHISPLSLAYECFSFDDHQWSQGEVNASQGLWSPAKWSQLKAMKDEGYIEIGTHGLTHTPWSWLDSKALTNEIVESQRRLENEFNVPVRTCSYPHGLSDISARRQAGRYFDFSFSTMPGRLTCTTSTSFIPRFHIPFERPNNLFSVVSMPLLGKLNSKARRLIAKAWASI